MFYHVQFNKTMLVDSFSSLYCSQEEVVTSSGYVCVMKYRSQFHNYIVEILS